MQVTRAAENLSQMRVAALEMLKAAPGPKVGIATRRLMAAWNDDFLASALFGGGN